MTSGSTSAHSLPFSDAVSAGKLRAAVNDVHLGPEGRLEALRRYVALGFASRPVDAPGSGEVNNHIHTIYSFSPYTPSMAALRAYEAGLEVAGSVDHDSIAAAPEMTRACALLGLGSVTGCEIRVTFPSGFSSRKINNPDSSGIVYMTIQGVPAMYRAQVAAFLAPIRVKRMERTARMAQRASALLEKAGIPGISIKDVAALSMEGEGGGITERHLCYAVATRLTERHGIGPALVAALEKDLGLPVPAKVTGLISDPSNQIALYDLVNILKTDFLARIFVQPDGEECLPVEQAVSFAKKIGAIPAYAYLGDVGESPTGDKKAEKFEDDYLDELFEALKNIGFLGVTYMPPRNTREQLLRVRSLCQKYSFMEISGVDINQPRQAFTCHELKLPEFSHLVDTTWALVTHERLASIDSGLGLFSPSNPLASLPLESRLAQYARAGRMIDPFRPDSVEDAIVALREGRNA